MSLPGGHREDPSRGYDELAEDFISTRTDIGARLVHDWARAHIPDGGKILDAGCGSGIPITSGLIEEGFDVYALDASQRMLEIFSARFPQIPTRCETIEEGALFAREFDAVIAIGVVFLLDETAQRSAIENLASAVSPGGRLMFSAPHQIGGWTDSLTRQGSVSLGRERYIDEIERAGLEFVACHLDEGENNYYAARKL